MVCGFVLGQDTDILGRIRQIEREKRIILSEVDISWLDMN